MIDIISKIFSIVIIIIIIWIWFMNHRHPECDSIWIKEVLNTCKTGDLILFKAMDNYNSSLIFSYFTHVGIVYTPKKTVVGSPPYVYLFEAQSPTNLTLDPEKDSERGIYLTDLYDRLSKYKGKLYFKELNRFVDPQANIDFDSFVLYALNNMHYDDHVIWNGLKKKLLFEKMHNGTNCGELTLLSLIKLGILNEDKYNWKVLHHLLWMANIEECDNGFRYLPIKEIKISPFGERA